MKVIYIFTTLELLSVFNFSIFFTKLSSFLIFYGGFDFALLVLYLNNVGFPPFIELTWAYKVDILTLVTLLLIDDFKVNMPSVSFTGK